MNYYLSLGSVFLLILTILFPYPSYSVSWLLYSSLSNPHSPAASFFPLKCNFKCSLHVQVLISGVSLFQNQVVNLYLLPLFSYFNLVSRVPIGYWQLLSPELSFLWLLTRWGGQATS